MSQTYDDELVENLALVIREILQGKRKESLHEVILEIQNMYGESIIKELESVLLEQLN